MLKKLLTSFLGVFRDDSATVLFPGFGVQPENYVVKFPTQHVIRLNIWSEEDYNNIYLIGYPGTRSYRRWFEEKAAACLHNLTQELQNLGAKKVVYFGHSLGSQLAHHIAEKTGSPVISYGGLPYPEKNYKQLTLLGTHDKIVAKYYSKWPERTLPVSNGNHFSCVNEDGKARAEKWRKKLGMRKVYESADDDEVSRKQIDDHLHEFYKSLYVV